MMKKKNILQKMLFAFICFSATVYAQTGRVGINTTKPASTLDIQDKDPNDAAMASGLQAPRVKQADLIAKGNTVYTIAQTGTLLYVTDFTTVNTNPLWQNIDADGYYFYDGTAWQKIITGLNPKSNAWNLNYNDKLTSNNFIGTTDNQDFNLRTYNTNRIIFSKTQKVGIGVSPEFTLDSRKTIQIRKGGDENTFSGNEQILFGYNNTATLRHALRTRHGDTYDKMALDFYTWQPGDGDTGLPTRHQFTVKGENAGINGNTAPLASLEIKDLPANSDDFTANAIFIENKGNAGDNDSAMAVLIADKYANTSNEAGDVFTNFHIENEIDWSMGMDNNNNANNTNKRFIISKADNLSNNIYFAHKGPNFGFNEPEPDYGFDAQKEVYVDKFNIRQTSTFDISGITGPNFILARLVMGSGSYYTSDKSLANIIGTTTDTTNEFVITYNEARGNHVVTFYINQSNKELTIADGGYGLPYPGTFFRMTAGNTNKLQPGEIAVAIWQIDRWHTSIF